MIETWKQNFYNHPNKTYSYMYSCLSMLITDKDSWLSKSEKESLLNSILEIEKEDCSEEFSSTAKAIIRREFENYFAPKQKKIDEVQAKR